MKWPRNTLVHVGVLVLLIAAGNLQTATAKRYCGSELPKILSMLCLEYFSLEDLRKNTVGFYGTPNQFSPSQLDWAGENFNENEFKRNFNMLPRAKQLEEMEDEFALQWFKKKPFHRIIVPHMQARFRRDVADECCREDCSMAQLLSYCKVVAPGVLVA
uniref:Insulin-like domain-containing protein n=1 Tax=Anopheles epiroticus TaxID=199890 RepID=A0A182P8E7_9DIPT